MKTETAPPTINLNKGKELLRKAVAAEHTASRYWAQYVQWTVEEKVSLAQIAEQLKEAKGYSTRTANKNARNIVMLGQPENLTHLENLMNGEISFNIAGMRVTPRTVRKQAYQDDETAAQLVQKAVVIMVKRHNKWTLKDLTTWITGICEPLIKQKNAKQS